MTETAQPLATRVVAPPRFAPPPYGGQRYAPVPPAFNAGTVIGRTFSVWWRHVLPFATMSLVVYAPVAIGLAALFAKAAGPDPADPFAVFAPAVAGGWLVTMLLHVPYTGAIGFAVFRGLRGGRIGLGAMVGEGFRRFFPLAGVMLLFGLATTFATLLLVFPAIMLGCAWAAAVPSCVVERTGPVESLRRSAELTRGVRMQVFLAYLAVFAVMWAASAAVQVVAMVVAIATLPDALEPAGTMVASQLANVLFGALPLVVPAVIYHDLRAAREGLDAGSLASVFD